MSLEVLLYSQVLRLSDHENKRFYNDEEEITFVPENSLKAIRKKNHRKRYKKKLGNHQFRKWSEKPNNVSEVLFSLFGLLAVSLKVLLTHGSSTSFLTFLNIL